MRTLTIILTFLSFHLSASSEWTQYWISGIKARDEGNLKSAEKKFSEAITLMESANDSEHPYVYIDRAEIYIHEENYESALLDLNIALESKKLSNSDMHNTILLRLVVKSNLGALINIDDPDVSFVVDNSDVNVEHTEDKLIIRNLPDCESFISNLPCLFIHSGMCNSKEDVQFYKSGICVVNKRCSCKSAELPLENIFCDGCGTFLQRLKQEDRTIEGCKSWCDLNSLTAQGWCSKTFKSSRCQVLCLAAVYGIEKTCHWCCKDGAFYEKCVAPFADIISQMGNVCDPAWD